MSTEQQPLLAKIEELGGRVSQLQQNSSSFNDSIRERVSTLKGRLQALLSQLEPLKVLADKSSKLQEDLIKAKEALTKAESSSKNKNEEAVKQIDGILNNLNESIGNLKFKEFNELLETINDDITGLENIVNKEYLEKFMNSEFILLTVIYLMAKLSHNFSTI